MGNIISLGKGFYHSKMFEPYYRITMFFKTYECGSLIFYRDFSAEYVEENYELFNALNTLKLNGENIIGKLSDKNLSHVKDAWYLLKKYQLSLPSDVINKVESFDRFSVQYCDDLEELDRQFFEAHG